MQALRSLLFLIIGVALLMLPARAQIVVHQGMPPGMAEAQAVANTPLPRVLEHVLPSMGGKPFRETLTITGPDASYSASVDLQWLGPERFRLELTSPAFHQLRIVNGTLLYEKNDGSFLPRWLDDFAAALFNPVPPALMRVKPQGEMQWQMKGDAISSVCFARDDRPGGITNQLTWGTLCLASGLQLKSLLSFNRSLDFDDYRAFGKQQVAYTIKTSVLDYKPVTAHVTVLEELRQPAPDLLVVPPGVPASDPIQTAFVSTLEEEGLVEHAPVISWPSVREGKTEGYMIVYARTDRTGQVRETMRHNADNSALLDFGAQAALGYKFHPLMVDGVPQQMEMPLVLHFTTHIADPVPLLTDAQTRALMHGCNLPSPKAGRPPFRVEVSVTPEGKLAGERFPDANTATAPHRSPFQFAVSACTFSRYIVDGKPEYYHGELLLPAE